MQQAVGQQMEQKTAGEYWREYLEANPVVAMILSTIGAGLRWIFGGHFIVALGRWAIMTGGRIAEISMLFSVLWITADRVAPKLVITIPLHDQATSTAIIALSLLPEIILFHAVIVCHDHWRQAWQDGKLEKFHLVFAALYTIPTAMFIGMTVWTLVLTATTGTVITADGILLSARYLAGWFYSLVEMIYPFIARRYHRQISVAPALFDEPEDEPEKDEKMEQLFEEIGLLKEQLASLIPAEKTEPEPVEKPQEIEASILPQVPEKSAHISVNLDEDKLEKTIRILQEIPGISDEELAPHLGLSRPASARFWRLKVLEILPQVLSKNTDPEMVALQPKTTQKLSPEMLKFPVKNQGKTSGNLPVISLPKKNFFSKTEAAKLAKIRVKDIEDAITNHRLATAKNDAEKILKSSLEKFIVARKNQSKVSAESAEKERGHHVTTTRLL